MRPARADDSRGSFLSPSLPPAARRDASQSNRSAGPMLHNSMWCVLVVAALCATPSGVSAQSPPPLTIEIKRPDAVTEQKRDARFLPGAPEAPAVERIRPCGERDIALRRVSYDQATQTYHYWLLAAPRGTTQWTEWHFARQDAGRFQSQIVDSIKIFGSDNTTPQCADFQLPIYCIAACAGESWWSPAQSTPETVIVYLGWRRLLDLLMTKNIPFPGKIANPVLSISPVSAWDTNAVVGLQRDTESNLQLELSPKWSLLQDILLNQDGFEARLTFDAELNDVSSEGIRMPGVIALPVLVKPAPWLLLPPLVLGTLGGLLVRHLGIHKLKALWSEGGLLVLVSVLTWGLLYVLGAKFEIAIGQISADGFGGAAVIGLVTGLSGRKAIDGLLRIAGIAEAARKQTGRSQTTTLLVLGLTVLCEPLGAQQSARRLEPIAVAGVGRGQVAVLGANGDVVVVDQDDRKQLVTRLADREVTDLAGLTTPAGYSLLVSGWKQGGRGNVIGTLDLIPGSQPHLSVGTLYSGVVILGNPPYGFATDGKSRDIFRVVGSGGRLVSKYLASLPDPFSAPGAIAIDPTGSTLFVIDVLGGRIWKLPASGGLPEVFATDLREPRAIAVDDTSVFVADAGIKGIHVFPRAQKAGVSWNASAAKRLAPPQLEKPLGVALAGADELWVGDESAGAVFLLSTRDGQIKRVIR